MNIDILVEQLRANAVSELKHCQEESDTESAHANADEVLTNFLRAIGYPDVADEWDKVDKWYS